MKKDLSAHPQQQVANRALAAMDELAIIRMAVRDRTGTVGSSVLDSMRDERDEELSTEGETANQIQPFA